MLFCGDMVLTAHREFALELARASGEFIKPYFAEFAISELNERPTGPLSPQRTAAPRS